jgi:type 1 glutamine amidotransferase
MQVIVSLFDLQSMKRCQSFLIAIAVLVTTTQAAEPKRLLVVGATAGFRHPSIENGEKMIRQLAEKSGGEFTARFMSADPNYPRYPAPGARGRGGRGRGGAPAFPGRVMNASAEQQAAISAMEEALAPLSQAAERARAALAAATFTVPTNADDVKAKLNSLSEAELALAGARADSLSKLQASANRLSDEQLQALAGTIPPGARGGRRGGGPGGGAADPALAKVFQAYFNAEALKNYDGIFMVSTTGNLPIADLEALLKWVAEGHGYMGLHGAMDSTLPDAYVEMFGGGARFAGHPGGGNTARTIFRIDASHPASSDWPDGLAVVDEFYQFRGLDRGKIRSLLDMEFEGRLLPIAWVKTHGKGRVFYTSMGHRDDVMLPDIPALDYGNEKANSNEVSTAYQKHVLQGIRWALGLVDGDATPNPSAIKPQP